MEPKQLNRTLTIALWAVILVLVLVAVNTMRQKGTAKVRVPDGDWAKLMLVLGSVDKDYVDEIDHAKVTEEILPAIMSELDPHSVYLPPKDLQVAEEDLQGGFDGIGIQFTVPEDTAVVSQVISGGPSEKAGLLSGDRIVKVDGRTIAGVKMPQDSMVRLMKGKRGTKVLISVKRAGEQSLIDFPIVRDKIPVNTVDAAFMLDDTTAYVKLSKFARTSYFEFITAVMKLRTEGMKCLLFDLRGNTGGYLDQAVMLSNEFLAKGDLVVYMEGRKRPRQDIYADGKGTCQDVDLAVLIDEGSASSSEIFAGAMQDNDRGVIYGLRSYGKGLVQEPVYFSDGSGIRLTVARYYTPSGRCIQKPYDDYASDLLQRYRHGEMMSADSIKVNDSLKFTTRGGRTVYGGGGIIPDVFVPLDTTGGSEFLLKCNKLSLQAKFANQLSDRNREKLRSLDDMKSLNAFLDGLSLKEKFVKFAAEAGVQLKEGEWEKSGKIIETQLRALIGRNTPLNDEAFYQIYLSIDNVVDAAMKN